MSSGENSCNGRNTTIIMAEKRSTSENDNKEDFVSVLKKVHGYTRACGALDGETILAVFKTASFPPYPQQ